MSQEHATALPLRKQSERLSKKKKKKKNNLKKIQAQGLIQLQSSMMNTVKDVLSKNVIVIFLLDVVNYETLFSFPKLVLVECFGPNLWPTRNKYLNIII